MSLKRGHFCTLNSVDTWKNKEKLPKCWFGHLIKRDYKKHPREMPDRIPQTERVPSKCVLLTLMDSEALQSCPTGYRCGRSTMQTLVAGPTSQMVSLLCLGCVSPQENMACTRPGQRHPSKLLMTGHILEIDSFVGSMNHLLILTVGKKFPRWMHGHCLPLKRDSSAC